MKKILVSVAVVSIVAVAAFNLNLNIQKHSDSLLSLAHTEALASGESGNSVKCYDKIHQSPGHVVVYCPSCSIIEGCEPDFLSYSSTCADY